MLTVVLVSALRRLLLALFLSVFVGNFAHAAADAPAFTDPSAHGPLGAGRISFTAAPGLDDAAYRLAPGAARALAGIEADLEGLPRVEHVEVRLVRHAEDLAAAAPPGHGAPGWAVGVAWPDVGVVAVAARDAQGNLVDLQGTLAHELAHMALERALGAQRVPRWLHEGFAYQHSSEFEWGRAETLASALFRGDLLPIDALESSFPARHDAVALAYAESYDFVGFLAERGRWQDRDDDGYRWPFQHFLAQVAHGQGVDAAAQLAFGRTIAQLDAEWVDVLRARYLFYPVAALGGFFWVIMAGLAVLGWRRRRLQTRVRLAAMAAEEATPSAQAPGDGHGAAGELDAPVATHVSVEETR
jgi:Peptidase MA superfamily